MQLLPLPSAKLSVALLALHCTRTWANNIFNETIHDIEKEFDKAKDSFESEISKEVTKELDIVKGIIAQIPMGYSRQAQYPDSVFQPSLMLAAEHHPLAPLLRLLILRVKSRLLSTTQMAVTLSPKSSSLQHLNSTAGTNHGLALHWTALMLNSKSKLT
jgi:hypothetical protein